MPHGPAITRVLAALLAGLAIAGCGAVARNAAPSAARLAADLKGSPTPLAALHHQADAILSAGRSTFEARLRSLRGYPVVVTQWSSTCEPCQIEFPYFQQLSATLGRRVAFMGNDVNDTTAGATSWLRRFPVSFPSYRDPSNQIALALSSVFAYAMPVTYLFTRTGVEFFHVGNYLSESSLRKEIRSDLGV